MQICQRQLIVTYGHGCAHYDDSWKTRPLCLSHACDSGYVHGVHHAFLAYQCRLTLALRNCAVCVSTQQLQPTKSFMVMPISFLLGSNDFRRNCKCICSWWLSRNVSWVDRHNCIGQVSFVGTGWDLSWAHGQDLPTHFNWQSILFWTGSQQGCPTAVCCQGGSNTGRLTALTSL